MKDCGSLAKQDDIHLYKKDPVTKDAGLLCGLRWKQNNWVEMTTIPHEVTCRKCRRIIKQKTRMYQP